MLRNAVGELKMGEELLTVVLVALHDKKISSTTVLCKQKSKKFCTLCNTHMVLPQAGLTECYVAAIVFQLGFISSTKADGTQNATTA